MQLTDEEARHIEQRRLMENKFALGYNQCLVDLNAAWSAWTNNRETAEQIQQWIEAHRKEIRP